MEVAAASIPFPDVIQDCQIFLGPNIPNREKYKKYTK
jgi:hypothetical protein